MQELIRSYLSYIENEKNYSQHTVLSYANDLSQYFTFLKEQFPELIEMHGSVDNTVVRAFLGLMLENGIAKKIRDQVLEGSRTLHK